ncbi:MAG: FAD:protein FMN transferase [Botrimarina sp.]
MGVRLWAVCPACVGVAALLLAGCAKPASEPAEADMWSLVGPTMGTRYSLSVVGGDQQAADRLRRLVDERLAVVNKRMSTYDPGSELSRFNASDSIDWFGVSAETALVVRSALELAEATGGAYDPTVGPLVNLWGFGPDGRRDTRPTDDEIARAAERVGYGFVEARLDPPALRKQRPGVYVDLSSIAKGHGVDVVAELLEREGVAAFMVEIGGEVRTRGEKPGGRPWRIGVEKVAGDATTDSADRPLQLIVELRGESLATSGDYRNFFELGGRRYSHTIDPKSGEPVEHDLATVTVQAETCREADGLATALLVLGPRAGYDWAVERGVAALLVSRSESDEHLEQTTPGWDERVAVAPTQPTGPTGADEP